MRSLLVILALTFAAAAAAQGTLLAVYNTLSRIDVINPASGAAISQQALTSSVTIFGFTGLAQDPTTGTLYAAVRTTSTAQNIFLGTVNRSAGTVTLINEFNVAGTGESISNIQFDDTGALWAISGVAASLTPNPETLFSVNKATAAMTLFQALGNGQNSEALGFEPLTPAVMYHFTGTTAQVFESVNLTTGATGNIPITTPPTGSQTILCLAYDSFNSWFWTCTNSAVFGRIHGGGAYQIIGSTPGAAKGLVVLPTINTSVANLPLGTTPQGTAGAPQSFNLTGFNLFGDVNIAAPTGVEISLSVASGYTASLNVPRSGVNRQLNSTQIFVRIASTAPAGAITANLNLTAMGADNEQIALTGQVNGPREIDVFRAAMPVASGSTDAVGTRNTGQAFTLTYDIDNSGNLPLTLTVPVTPTGQGNCTATVLTQPSGTVAGLGTTQLVLSVTPTADGAFSFTISIGNDDSDENPYTYTVSGLAAPAGSGTSDDGGVGSGCSSFDSPGPELVGLLGLLAVIGVSRRSRRPNASR